MNKNNFVFDRVVADVDAESEEMLKASARSAYDQNHDLMTPKEILLFVLFGYVEEPPVDDGAPPPIIDDLKTYEIEDPF